jgi:hypothetical protein
MFVSGNKCRMNKSGQITWGKGIDIPEESPFEVFLQ